MGGGSSVGIAPDDDEYGTTLAEEKEINIHALMKTVEKFVINVYASCPRVESMWLILSSNLGQTAFNTFAKVERADEYFILFKDIATVRSIMRPNKYVLAENLIRINNMYFKADAELNISIPNQLRQEMSYVQHLDLEQNESIKAYFVELLERLQNEMVFIMAREQFNRFILSKYYKQWRAAESSHAVATTITELSPPKLEKVKSARMNVEDSESMKIINKLRNIINPIDMTAKAFSNINNEDLRTILGRSDGWLTALISAVEVLPICFTLSAVRRKKSEGFPLIYVNKYFEKITGFNRGDITGTHCQDFLHCPETEPEQVAIMSDGLKNMTPSIVIVTNRFYDGGTFKNLVALKPVLDDRKKYRYVIGIMFDVTKENDAAAAKLKLAEDLIGMIPGIIYTDEDHAGSPKSWFS